MMDTSLKNTFAVLLAVVFVGLATTSTVVPATTALLGPGGVVTAHSSQVVARNYNRLYVPGYVPTTVPVPAPAYPFYPAYVPYPSVYKYPGYPYGYYPYPYPGLW